MGEIRSHLTAVDQQTNLHYDINVFDFGFVRDGWCQR